MNGSPSQKNELDPELQRLYGALGGSSDSSSAMAVDSLLQRFQKADHRNRGAIAAIEDFDLLVDHFLTSKGRFDYVAFCKALSRCGKHERTPSTGNEHAKQRSPRKRVAGPASPQKRRHRPPEHQPRIRVDRRLEVQRLMTQSIRKKLLRGVYGAKSDGFLGVQDTLFNLDGDGEGYLDERVFSEQFLPRLKSPLTQAETEFLLINIRMRGGEKDSADQQQQQQQHDSGDKKKTGKFGRHYRIDYEQMGAICNLDSDMSLSSDSGADRSDSDTGVAGYNGSPMKAGNNSNSTQSNLGADFLAAEKRVQTFLRQHLQAPSDDNSNNGSGIHDTPRTLFTGAERFLEYVEETDRRKSGFLREQDFERILKKCDVEVSPTVLSSILSRFPRTSGGLINYTSFLQRYGQNPQHSRERRKLKRFLLGVLPSLRSSRAKWSAFLKDRFEKYDAKLHKVKGGEISEREFLHVLRGKTGPLKLSAEQAIEILTLFLAVSPSSSPTKINYTEFLRFIQELLPPSPESPTKSATHIAPVSSPAKHIAADSHNASSSLRSPSKASANNELPATEEAATVGDYLMFHSTTQERENFEQLMDLLHKFHSKLPPPMFLATAAAGSPGRSPSKKSAAMAPAIVPIENGVQIALGEKLRVQIQFSTERT